MKKLGIFVGERGLWKFFKEIYEDLTAHYKTNVFTPKHYRLPFLEGRLNHWAYQNGIRNILKNNDVCFFEWASEMLEVASHMPKQSKIVTRLHSFELYSWAPKINWDAVDKIILVSHAMQEMFTDLYPKHGSKTQVIYNGRSLDQFKPPVQKSYPLKIGMLGNIAPIKRIYEFIFVFHAVIQQGYDIQLHIAGQPAEDYRYYVAIQRLVKTLNLEGRIFFNGFIKDTPAWLQNIDILISNSYWEGQQVALIEGMASGCYCLSHFWKGVEEMLPAENIYITDAELQAKIIDYINQSNVEKNSSQALLRSLACEKFDIELTKIQIRQVINEL